MTFCSSAIFRNFLRSKSSSCFPLENGIYTAYLRENWGLYTLWIASLSALLKSFLIWMRIKSLGTQITTSFFTSSISVIPIFQRKVSIFLWSNCPAIAKIIFSRSSRRYCFLAASCSERVSISISFLLDKISFSGVSHIRFCILC